MAAHFSHEAGKTTIIHASQQFEMQKVYMLLVPEKNSMRMAFNFPFQYKEDGNDFLEQMIRDNESWIYFYESERKSSRIVWKKRERSAEIIQR